jgi:hypothetical protein
MISRGAVVANLPERQDLWQGFGVLWQWRFLGPEWPVPTDRVTR